MKSTATEPDKNRFVAFAFAASETFLEIDASGKIIFQTGVGFSKNIVENVNGKARISSLKDIIHPDDVSLFDVSIKKLARNGRVGPVNIKVGGHNGKWAKIIFYGIFLPENKDRFYLSLRSAGVTLALPMSDAARDKETKLLDKDAFTKVAAQAMQASDDAQITMTRFAGLSEHAKTATEEEHSTLLKDIASHLQSLSVDGQVAARVGDEEFAIINDNKTTTAEIEATIKSIPNSEAITAISSTILKKLTS